MNDWKADKSAAIDRSEAVGLMDPLLLGESSLKRSPLADLVVDLAGRAAGFRRSLRKACLPRLPISSGR